MASVQGILNLTRFDKECHLGVYLLSSFMFYKKFIHLGVILSGEFFALNLIPHDVAPIWY